MTPVTVKIKPLDHYEGLALPAYETAQSAGRARPS